MSSLKQALFDQYNRDSRRKTLPPHSIFCVDDRAPSDVASDRSLYGYFCEIIADAANDPIVDVRLTGNVPIGPEVEAWVSANGAAIKQTPRYSLEFSVAPGEESKLLELAAAIEVITSRRYDTPSYKYVCPRTAQSLRRLASVLASARGT